VSAAGGEPCVPISSPRITSQPPAYFGAVSPLEATPALVRRGELRVEGDEVANRRDAGVALDHLALQ
jgi:hypothetical protein